MKWPRKRFDCLLENTKVQARLRAGNFGTLGLLTIFLNGLQRRGDFVPILQTSTDSSEINSQLQYRCECQPTTVATSFGDAHKVVIQPVSNTNQIQSPRGHCCIDRSKP